LPARGGGDDHGRSSAQALMDRYRIAPALLECSILVLAGAVQDHEPHMLRGPCPPRRLRQYLALEPRARRACPRVGDQQAGGEAGGA